MTSQVTLRYTPFVPFRAFHSRSQRFAVLVCSRRAGKTVAVINDLVQRALNTKKIAPNVPRPFYGYVAPYLKQAKQAAWVYLKQIAADLGAKTNEAELSVTLPNSSVIRVFGADNPDSFRGAYFDGVVLDEFGDMKAITWTLSVRPALADRQGWAVFIGTPRGKNAFYRIREQAKNDRTGRWFYLELPASRIVSMGGPKTGWGVLTAEELQDSRNDLEDNEYRQEFECDFEAANIGSYYGKHIQSLLGQPGVITFGEDLFDQSEKVHVAHDPGRDDAWSIWFWQYVNGHVVFIDYWEESGFDAEEVLQVLELKPYSYGTWFVPHDALHRTAQSRKSILDTFREGEAPARKVPNPDEGNRILHGVGAVRRVLRTWPVRFDGTRCARGIEALRNYSRKFDNDTKVFSEQPKHDQWSHGADAFRYACLSLSEEELPKSVARATARARDATQASRPVNTPDSFAERFTFQDAIAHQQRRLAAQRSEGRTRL